MTGIPDSAYPLISVVTPVRNLVDTFPETIESILTQEYPNLEYIVIDGGSTDGSLDVIQQHANEIDVFLYGRDRNMYDALGKAFDVARGSVLAWLNADDIYEPGVLKRVGEVFAKHPDWDVVYFDGTIWKEGWRTPNRNQRPVGLPELMRGHILYQDSVFWTRRAYTAVGGLDRIRYKWAGDYDLWLRLAEKYEFHYIPQTASCFRLRPGQLSGDWGAYTKEMAFAQSVARERQRQHPPTAPGRSLFSQRRRIQKSRSIEATRKFSNPLKDEHLPWPPVVSQSLGSLAACRCILCGAQPERLLFSTPDTWFGDRRIWHVYFCEKCSASNVFPQPTDSICHELTRLAHRPLAPVEPPNGAYRLSAASRLLEGNDLYVKAANDFNRFLAPGDDRVNVKERPEARIIEIGSGSGRMLEALRDRGFTNVSGYDVDPLACSATQSRGFDVTQGELFSLTPPVETARAIILHGTLECFHDPVAALNQVRPWLQTKGRVYISTPNLDSIWASRYGPMWSRWHAPFHRFLFSPRALRKLASRTGYRVRWMSSCSPPDWLYHSDLLAAKGLGGWASPPSSADRDPLRWQHALGASILSRLRWDWRLKGDCLQACFVKQGS